MSRAVTRPAPSAVHISAGAAALRAFARAGVELAVWRRGVDGAWASWLEQLPVHALPACRLQVTPQDAADALHASCDASGTPCGPQRDAFVADAAALVARFAATAGVAAIRMRLDVVSDNACRRWHRDCVPLRLICTYRGPATLWIPPRFGAAVLARADDEASQSRALQTGDVALFKGCGWPGQQHNSGIVHRSPRIEGTGLVRLVLVLDPPPQRYPTRSP